MTSSVVTGDLSVPSTLRSDEEPVKSIQATTDQTTSELDDDDDDMAEQVCRGEGQASTVMTLWPSGINRTTTACRTVHVVQAIYRRRSQ